MSTTEDRTGGELREGYAEVGDQRLHYVEAGDGPLIVLLHGFPEFWYGWRLQIQPLAAADPRPGSGRDPSVVPEDNLQGGSNEHNRGPDRRRAS